MSIAARITEAFTRNKELTALQIGDDLYTYAQLHTMATSIAIECRLTEKAGVGVLGQRTVMAYSATLACVLSNSFFVPLNVRFPISRLVNIVQQSGLKLVLFDASQTRLVENLKQYLNDVTFKLIDCSTLLDSETLASLDVAQNDIRYMMFTSGTTGNPKGVPISEGNLSSYLDFMLPYCDLHSDDRCSQYFDASFDLSIHDIFVTFLSGATLVVAPEIALMAPGQFIKKQGITIWFSVPSVIGMMSKLKQLKADSYPSLRKSFFCGEALFYKHVDAWQSACPNSKVINLYGPTEATIACSYYEVPSTFDKSEIDGIVPIGRPFGNVTFNISEQGELLIAGAQITEGYLNDPEKNRLSFINQAGTRFYRSGDLVKQANNVYGYLGRLDDQVKINGYRIELKEIEAVILDNFEVNQVKVLTINSLLGKSIIAFLQSDAAKISIEQLKNVLPDYMIPKELIFLPKMPLNSNGKIDKKALIEYRSNHGKS